MKRNVLWIFAFILALHFTFVLSEGTPKPEESRSLQIGGVTDLESEGRTRKHHHKLWYLWGWHALAIAYWVKVKLVVVGFFVGSAIFVALRYAWPNKCSTGVVHDSPAIIYDHPPPSFAHDHVPYSLDHSNFFDHSYSSSDSVDPYSAYSGSFSQDITATAEEVPPTAPGTHRVWRRSLQQQANYRRQETETTMNTEERIAEFFFDFLGLDSSACRRRFICEMEFRSRFNPISAMAFRIVGRSFFEKYTNARNPLGQAHSFGECAAVNPECEFIEQNDEETNSPPKESAEEHSSASGVENEIDVSSAENHNTDDGITVNVESQNEANLKTERLTKKSLIHRFRV
ncbi:uncharacterized protein LOC101451665 [Ceratitis capitata]|uniref:uncharacterized protein LOC101451665 n=1 Tax=Ceratitis capitata TaxID=7213 RepID=UPI000329DEE5|nr:uncharacterized protein LOC101451665 [Ceratitis capitata]